MNENSDALDGVRKKLIQSCCSFLCLAVLSSCAPGKNKMEKSNHGLLENRVWRILHCPLNKYHVQAFSHHLLQPFALVVRHLHIVHLPSLTEVVSSEFSAGFLRTRKTSGCWPGRRESRVHDGRLIHSLTPDATHRPRLPCVCVYAHAFMRPSY